MLIKKFGNKYVIRIDKGEEIIETLKTFCKSNNIKLGSISGIGAANKIVLGLFETDTKKYLSQEFVGDFEIVPLAGNISTMKGETYLHLHANIADIKHNSFGGHLTSAVVSATFEVIIDTIDGEVDRKFSNEIGLNLLEL